MEEFNLLLKYKDRELSLPVRFKTWGYTVRVEVEVNGTQVYFEPDEERNWRAVLVADQPAAIQPDPGLLAAIAEEIGRHT